MHRPYELSMCDGARFPCSLGAGKRLRNNRGDRTFATSLAITVSLTEWEKE